MNTDNWTNHCYLCESGDICDLFFYRIYMKKIFVLACGVVLFATSCLSGGGSAGTSSADYSGRLTVSEIESGKTTYTDDKAVVTVQIPNIIEPKVDVIFNNIKFATMMPKLNIEFEGLPFVTTVSEDETTLNYIFNVKNVVINIIFLLELYSKIINLNYTSYF